MQTKVLIVGAGPSGSACGIKLLQEDIDCIVVEKSVFPRTKLCAGLLTHKAQDILRLLLGDDFNRCMQDVVMNYASDFSIFGKNGCLVSCRPSEAITLIDRPLFDEWMINYYIGHGGRVLQGDPVIDIDLERNIVTLASGTVIQFEHLVACDGANSTIEKLLSKQFRWDFKRKDKNSLCLEINVRREDIDIKGVNIYFDVVPGSYAWAFSKGEKVCLGLVQLQDKKFDVNARMREFCEKIGVQNIDSYPLRGAMLPLGNCRKKRAFKNVLFAGDAAGLVEPLTGEGIFFAIESGCFAAEAINTPKPARNYQKNTEYLAKLVKKGAYYQRLMNKRWAVDLFEKHAGNHPDFVKYFYDTQIEHASLETFSAIVLLYKVSAKQAPKN